MDDTLRPRLELSDDGRLWFPAPLPCAFWPSAAIEALKAARGFRQHRVVWRVPARASLPFGLA